MASPRNPLAETVRIWDDVAIVKSVLEELMVEVPIATWPMALIPNNCTPVEDAIVRRLAVWPPVPWIRSVVEAACVPWR